jgi:hypothetical protein
MILRPVTLAVCAALGFSLFATGSAHAATSAKPAETLRAFATRLLLVAPTNFSSLRGAPTGTENYYSRYRVLTKLGACAGCKLTDEYSWTGHAENWYVEDEWHGAKGASQAKIVSYVTSQLGSSLATYSLKKTGASDYPTFKWSGPKNRWVFVHIFNGGFTLKVGHDLVKPLHMLLAPTTQQLAALRAGAGSFVSSGVGAASSNFEPLRAAGKKGILDNMEYDLYVPFGSMLPKCNVTDATANTFNLDDYSPKWTMNCETLPMVGTKAMFEDQIRAAMQGAIPSGFTQTTDRTVLYFDDYRWDNTTTQVAVTISSLESTTLPDGLVQFSLGVIHFLPKPSAT